MAWLPDDFVHPTMLPVMDGFHLRPIRASDTEIGYRADPARQGSLGYALVNLGETELFGCVYIDQPETAGADAEISWWVVGAHLEDALAVVVPRWIDRVWPFERPKYALLAPPTAPQPLE